MADAEQVYRAHPTSEEVAEVLARRLVAAVGTLNEDGSIHLAFVLFLHHDGRLYFETASVTRKAGNAARGGWASMLVQGRASTGRNLMVSAEGTARVLDGPEAQDLNHRLRAKYIKPEALDGVDRAWGRLDDVAVEITPRRWRSWTGSVLHDETRKELPGSYEDAWLPDDQKLGGGWAGRGANGLLPAARSSILGAWSTRRPPRSRPASTASAVRRRTTDWSTSSSGVPPRTSARSCRKRSSTGTRALWATPGGSGRAT